MNVWGRFRQWMHLVFLTLLSMQKRTSQSTAFSVTGSGFDDRRLSMLHDKISVWGTHYFYIVRVCVHGGSLYLLPLSLCVCVCCRGNFTVPKLSESNMGFGMLGVFLGLLLEVSTHGPHAVARTSWKRQGEARKVECICSHRWIIYEVIERKVLIIF